MLFRVALFRLAVQPYSLFGYAPHRQSGEGTDSLILRENWGSALGSCLSQLTPTEHDDGSLL